MKSRSEETLKPGEVIPFIKDCLASEDKTAYLNKIYTMLEKLKTGDEINIDNIVKKVNVRFFIRCVCAYICEIDKGVQFSDDYTLVIKKQTLKQYLDESPKNKRIAKGRKR